jgi:hypothetical protein
MNPLDFSLVIGGPFYRLLRGVRLTDDALNLVRRRVVVAAMILWLPLLLLSAMDGSLLAGKAGVPFLMDIAVHARFLLAIPLLIAAELIVHRRLHAVARVFMERRLVAEDQLPGLKAAVASAARLRDSVLVEVLLVAFVYFVGVSVVWRHYMAIHEATWYAVPAGDGMRLTLAGWWYVGVSIPVFQFLLCRWYFRIFVWARLLWQVSRLQLKLVPTHPDRAGGLGFLSNTAYAFGTLAMAHGVVLAAALANSIFHLGANLTQFKSEPLLLVILMLCLFLGPLLIFTPHLLRTKRASLREYGNLAEVYGRAFESKWLRGHSGDEPLLGSADIQSLADLGNSVGVVQEMRLTVIKKQAALLIAGVTIAPVLPLVLTLIPLEELLKKLFGIFL